MFTYNKEQITIESISAFDFAAKSLNDKNNKTRENIIGAIINDKVPAEYYELSRWIQLKTSVLKYIIELDSKPFDRIECKHKGGRKFNFDFNIIFYYAGLEPRVYNIELKFNASAIDDAPQFVSPMKPSQYLSSSYEEYYYTNYLGKLAEATSGLLLPAKEIYMAQIHTNKPKCINIFQEIYYKGCAGSSKFTKNEEDIKFYELAKELSNESISTFIEKNNLNIGLLSEYLQASQKGKIYMLYSEGQFTKQNANLADYMIVSVIKNPQKFRYECLSANGKKINVLLRWKNGNGIAFPAFQIS
uniref:Uncharacterized protein n=1 Tax=viral metagenome TaxID=1070528 RepID=A0A6C0I7L1_9ZZZZ